MKILIYHASAGHGHKKVADVLKDSFDSVGGSDHEVRVEDALDYTPFTFRVSYPAVYFNLVKYAPNLWGWFYEFFDKPLIAKCVKGARHLFNLLHGMNLLNRVIKEKPDIIICTHFFSAELFASAKKKGKLQAKLITVITDFFPHAFWINEGTDVYWVMNETSKKAMLERGVEDGTVVPGGIPVDPIFKPKGKKEFILKENGFQVNRLTLLITSGSFGLGPYQEILNFLKPYEEDLQCFVVCGNNAEMQDALDKQEYPFPTKVMGFVDNMHELMEASDILLAKPGGATTVESLAKGIVMIILNPIPGQESRNAHFLLQQQASFFMRTPEDIKPIMETIMENPSVVEEKKDIVEEIARPGAAENLVKFALGDNES